MMIFYIFLFIVSFFLTYFIKNFALKRSLVAVVNERSSHTVPTPHGGGIAIAFVWFGGLIYLFAYDKIDAQLFYALMVGSAISIVSFLDDLYDLSARMRLAVQSAVAVAGLSILGGLQAIDLGLLLVKQPIVTNFFAFLMIVWFINLYNFLDGIDGYAGSQALFLALAGGWIFGGAHFGVLGAAVLGFLVWNWDRAKIFMGDVGSTLLGYTVAVFTIYYSNQTSAHLWIWIILFGLFWFDATVTLVRRKIHGEELSQAHKKHAYQRLTQAGYRHYQVVLASIMVNIVLFFMAYWIENVYMALGIAVVWLYSCMKYVDLKKAFV